MERFALDEQQTDAVLEKRLYRWRSLRSTPSDRT